MAIVIQCPQCDKRFRVNSELAGKRVKCPCGYTLDVSLASDDAGSSGKALEDLLSQEFSQQTQTSPQAGMRHPSAGTPFPAATSARFTPTGSAPAGGGGSSRGNSKIMIWVAIGVGGGVVLLIVIGTILMSVLSDWGSPSDNGPAVASQSPTKPEPSASVTKSPSPTEKVRATKDTVGTKGKDYEAGIITTPIGQYFRLQDRIKLLQITAALKLYRAQHAGYPKSFEAFEQEILKPSRIKLPDLPRGHTYSFDSEKGELMVNRPRN